MEIVDTHTHLYLYQFDDDFDEPEWADDWDE